MLATKVEQGGSDSGEEGAGAGGGVGRLVDSSQADDRRMIALVRARRLLYARNNMPVASYYSQVKKLWQEVADEMGWTVAEVRRKWSHVRNSYSRHLRNEMHGVRTGRGRKVSRWYLADELHFLREHMATDTRQCRYSYAPMYTEPNEDESSSAEQALMSSPWFALSQASHQESLASASQPRPDDAVSPTSFEADENSTYFQFFRGIYNDYQELPASQQRLFRRECLAALHRLLDAEEAARPNLHHGHQPERDVCVIDRVKSERAHAASTPP